MAAHRPIVGACREHGDRQLGSGGNRLGLEAGGSGRHQVGFFGQALVVALAGLPVSIPEGHVGSGEHQHHRDHGADGGQEKQHAGVEGDGQHRPDHGEHAGHGAREGAAVPHCVRSEPGGGTGRCRETASFRDHAATIGGFGPV